MTDTVPGVHLVGYLGGVMGTGENARQLLAALRTQQVPLTTTTLHLHTGLEDDDLARSLSGARAIEQPSATLLCVNADSVPAVASALPPEILGDRYAIGFWWWEVSSFPDRFKQAFSYLDEVWVGSTHVRDAISAHAAIPVVRIPQPVSLPEYCRDEAAPEGLPDGFRFVFAFDYLSVFERKNPIAAVHAFAAAFPPGSGAVLIIKSLNDDYDRSAHERLRQAAAAHPDIHLIERTFSQAERDGLMRAADCYVSLHRAEGFGYTLAEAMWFGKPVIATAYSGNLDYMTAENSYPVNYRLVPIGAGREPYPADGTWAEPDVDHAAMLMRDVFENREQARRKGERAAEEIRVTHSPEVAGRAMVQRLASIDKSAAWHGALRRGRLHAKRAGELVRSGPAPAPRPRFGRAQRLARRAVFRAMKPATVHQERINKELVEGLDALSSSLRSLGGSQRAGDESSGSDVGPSR